MDKNKLCPKCNGDMLKAIHEDSKTITQLKKTVDIFKYVCLQCGYVEEYADIEQLNNL